MSKIINFFTGVARETKRVRWLTVGELTTNTGIVLSIVALFGLFFMVSDFLILNMLRALGFGV